MKWIIFFILVLFVPLEADSQINPEQRGLEGLTAKDYQKAMEQIETARFWSFWSGYVALGIIAFFSLIFYFATWAVVKKILHKKHPKLIGAIVVVVFIFILFILYYGLASGYFR